MKKIIFGIVAVVGLSFGTMAQTEESLVGHGQLVDYDVETNVGTVVTQEGNVILIVNPDFIIVVTGADVTFENKSHGGPKALVVKITA